MEKIFRCDKGIMLNGDKARSHNQRNNYVNGDIACNVTSMAQSLEFMGYVMKPYNNTTKTGVKAPAGFDALYPKQNWRGVESEGSGPTNQIEDYFYHYINTNAECKKDYKETNSTSYNAWIKECQDIGGMTADGPMPDKALPYYYDKDKKYLSYPPTEIYPVFCKGVNKYMQENYFYKGNNFPNKIFCEFSYSVDKTKLLKELKLGKPVVLSVQYGTLGHVLTLVGVKIDKDTNTGTEKIISFITQDTYGKFDFNSKKYIEYNNKTPSSFEAKEYEISENDFLNGGNVWKNANGCITFNFPS